MLRNVLMNARICTNGRVSVRIVWSRAASGGVGVIDSKKTRSSPVTVWNDDGRVPWVELSTGEKVARTTQQSFNLGVVFAGIAGTSIVAYYLYTEVFSPNSKTVQFNRAVDRIRSDGRCLDMLGHHETVRAFGESSPSKWTRNRPLASNIQHEETGGLEHLRMHFNVQGSERRGVVTLHLVRIPGQSAFEYRTFALNVSGFPTYYLEDGETARKKSPGFRMLGIQWR